MLTHNLSPAMSTNQSEQRQSQLNPNATSFQPYGQLSLNPRTGQQIVYYSNPFNQPIFAYDHHNSFMSGNLNHQYSYPNESLVANSKYVPHLRQQSRAATDSMKVTKATTTSISKKPPRQNICDTMPCNACNKIMYDVYELTASAIANLNEQNKKSQSNQPHAVPKPNDNFLSLLISGYCRKFLVPLDLMFLIVRCYGNKPLRNKQFIAIHGEDSGFGCIDFETERIVYYIPKQSYSMSDYKIIATATDLVLPSNLINHYNTLTHGRLPHYTRFNAMFIVLTNSFSNVNLEIFCVLFNDEHALELKLPPCPCGNRPYEFAAFYSAKYGLLVAANMKLIVFSWAKWKWSVMVQVSPAFEAITFMHVLETRNKIFTFSRVAPKRCYLFDLNDSTIDINPCKGIASILQKGSPIFCFDDMNERIFALQTVGKKNGRGMIVALDLKTLQWSDPRLPRSKKLLFKELWFDAVEDSLYAISYKKTKKYPEEKFWKLPLHKLNSTWQQTCVNLHSLIEFKKLK